MKKTNIIRSTVAVTIITVLIKFLGLLKQSILAACCGANDETDIFFVATGVIINLCSVVFSTISITLLSMYADRNVREGEKSANNLLNAALRLFVPAGMVMAVLFCIFSKGIAFIIAPSYSGEAAEKLSYYIRLMSAVFVFWSYYLTVNVVLEDNKIFIPGKCQGLFQNALLISAALFLYRRFGVIALIYSFLLSGVFESLLVTWCARNKFKILLKYQPEKEAMKKLLFLSLPLILGNAVFEVNDIVDKQISMGLGEGFASFLNYGSTINEIVTGVIVTSVSTVLFSHFATWAAEKKYEKIENGLCKVLEFLTVIIMPVMVMCIFAGDQLVGILFGRGSFGNYEIRMTYMVVIGYAAGFIFQAARANMAKVLYAFQNTRDAMINGVVSVAINITLSIVLSKYWGILGVSAATSISMLAGTLMFIPVVKKLLPDISFLGILQEAFKGVMAALPCALCVYFLHKAMADSMFMGFIIEGILCVLIYVMLMLIMKSRCMLEMLAVLKND